MQTKVDKEAKKYYNRFFDVVLATKHPEQEHVVGAMLAAAAVLVELTQLIEKKDGTTPAGICSTVINKVLTDKGLAR